MLLLLPLACTDAPPAETGDDRSDTGESADTSGSEPCAPGGSLATGEIRTTAGPFQGTPSAEGWAFLGLPFAAPPVGDLRFRPPAAPTCVETARSADTWPPFCPQWSDATHTSLFGDEDCLYLNVWTPTSDAGAGLPVLFFLHGGGNVGGGTAVDAGGYLLYEGADLAERFGAVVVTASYRLGALGFLATEGLTAESGTSGNWALLDQQAALGWVQAHAALFGGDPRRVLLFGESAGGLNTCALYTSPLSAGLFDAALMQSGACVATPQAQAERLGDELITAVGCAGDTADHAATNACLRSLGADAWAALSENPISELGVAGAGDFAPVVDGVVLPADPMAAIEAGDQLDLPLVVGSNTDETAQWVPSMTDEEYEALVIASLGEALGAQVLEVYPASDYASGRWAWIALTTDLTFHCPARYIHRVAGSTQTAPVYRYLFGNVPTGSSGAAYGAWHGLELVFVFQQLDEVVEATGYRPDDGDIAVEAAMGEAWVALAAGTMDQLSFAWAPEDEVLRFDGGAAAGADDRASYCAFWESLGG